MEIVTDGEEPAEMIQVEGMLGWVASAWKLLRGGDQLGARGWSLEDWAEGTWGTAQSLIDWEGLGQVPRNPWKLDVP